MCLILASCHVGGYRGHNSTSVPLCGMPERALTTLVLPVHCVIGSHFHLGLVRTGAMDVRQATGPKMAWRSHY